MSNICADLASSAYVATRDGQPIEAEVHFVTPSGHVMGSRVNQNGLVGRSNRLASPAIRGSTVPWGVDTPTVEPGEAR